ncbi:MAG: N-acetylmuramoyl-L-alanine amidase [Vicinamibacterales bacterium]
MPSSGSLAAAVAGIVLVSVLAPPAGAAQTAKADYTHTLGREDVLRRDLDTRTGGMPGPLLRRLRLLVSEYEAVARRYPRSGYSDNALYQGAVLSADAFRQFGDEVDRRTARRLFQALGARYPTSSLNANVAAHTSRLQPPPRAAAAAPDTRVRLKAIRREAVPGALRVTLELEQEASFHDERLEGPPRVFVDLQNTTTVAALRDATLGFPDDVVRQIRVGRQPRATRVVLDLEGAPRHSVYALYNPYRVVIDFERPSGVAAAAPDASKRPSSAPTPAPTATAGGHEGSTAAKDEPGATWTADSASAIVPATRAAPAAESPPPVPPATNRGGGFSLSRQLGLGISRVVIDAGHGGHDPGARVKGLNEADVTLDVALRLEKLLLAIPGVEVVMTRRTNVYVPLEERTAIANRAGADLFLSVHVNASRNSSARGIETYFLNFAPNKEAEAIAARENAGSSKTMSDLPAIVKAIALNNKIDESRDFAALVQTAMLDRLRKAYRETRNLGVKQAPFVVLIGATMPSVLAEISFLTNRQEAALLRTASYRQAIAEGLVAGISTYQRSLKAAQAVASQ